MKPDWDKLGDEYAGSSSVVIADVDCTADEAKDVCTDFGIQGYPTIKYFVDGDTTTGSDYQGGRGFDDLKKFTEDTLEVLCNLETLEECTDKEKGYITKMKAKSSEDVQAQLDRLEKMKGSSMKAELKRWLNQRLRILGEIKKSGGDEL
mmetsp:Transcript_19940/g.29533  ORF Transcript_19940/g.29533 Transcript_19940/m.29533 type:complete len:149 (-) Transcript_19940:493-939(-)|eukprot:CAMPEP_0194049032 /NCGR_PEP_ID=MMETSP0009_2-20130614/29426_1 /TAXON_ID=210454 /ORGANISM="Grammatophora oceanica, Strain CCMP 410" /LENGTH=148 /DNA_ID=CAMNT_0038695085 /DNA_START=222 /DNA_END=671 /DNA_ORIENTATION=+